MSQIVFANNASSTLAGPLSPTATTVQLQAGTGALFPTLGAGQIFKITFLDAATATQTEIADVTAITGDTLTVVRAREGTTGGTWAAGDFANNLITRDSLAAFQQTALATGTFFQGTDTNTAPNSAIVTATTPANTSPVAEQIFQIKKSGLDNLGGTTLQIASGTAYSVVYPDGSALNAGDWRAASTALLRFTGGVYQFLACAQNPATKAYFAVDTGTADALVATPVPPVAALGTNVIIRFIKSASPNATGTPTLAVSGLAAATITNNLGAALQPNDLQSGALYSVQYDVSGKWRLTSAAASQVLFTNGIFSSSTAGSSTFTPVRTGLHRITQWGAGGGGGASLAPSGTGGGGGGGGRTIGYDFLVAGTGYILFNGAAGVGGPGDGSSGATPGGTTSWRGMGWASGGGGGGLGNTGGSGTSGAGGTGLPAANINTKGQRGSSGYNGAALLGGNGGACPGAGWGNYPSQGTGNTDPTGTGSGGGGAANGGSRGGDGTVGATQIEY
jgi:alpha-D-ribose 1-methylphosphonate 5-triphosphate synthase subunit PhnG